MSSSEILFIQTAFIGDLLLSIPSLRAIKKEHPSSKLTLVCRAGLGDFMTKAQVADAVIEADKKSNTGWSKLKADLRAKAWDKIFCPHQSARSLLLVRSLSATKKIGYRSLLGKIVFDEAVERPMHLPEALRQLFLIESFRTKELLEFEPQANRNVYRRLPKKLDQNNLTVVENLKPVPSFARMQIPALSSAKENLIVLAPGSVWPTKKWTEEGFAQVAAHFAAAGSEIHLVGAPDEKTIAERVKSLAEAKLGHDGKIERRIINSTGSLSLWESAMLMGRAKLVITNDSGAMHMAACAGAPSASVFGPTVLEQGYRPWQTDSVVLHRVLSCRPCGKHGSLKCPIGTHECMTLVSAQSMIKASEKILAH